MPNKDTLRRVLFTLDQNYLSPLRPDLASLVNWRGGQHLPVHRWFRYREGFSPDLISALNLGPLILDPFAGSGSIMVGAAQQGMQSTGVDVNPLATFAARVKLRPLSKGELAECRIFQKSFKAWITDAKPWPQPALRIADKVFEPNVCRTLQKLRSLIEQAPISKSSRDFLHLSWLSILQDVGSYFKEGNGIKYRNKKRLTTGYVRRQEGLWQMNRFGPDQVAFVVNSFETKLDEQLADVDIWNSGRWRSQRVIEGNALEEVRRFAPHSFDSVIFSPPYANRFDYFESQKVELWFGGFVSSYEDMLALRKRSMRSHLGAALDSSPSTLPEVEELISLLDPESYAIKMRVPALIRGYFADMHSILTSCRRVLKAGGTCNVVVGNSAYAKVIFPTDSLVARIGRIVGFSTATVVPIRHLTVAPQQRISLNGFEKSMRESVVILS